MPAVKNEEMRRFVNTIGPWSMLVCYSLRNLQRGGKFIAAFISEKRKMAIEKSLFRNWQLIPNFFIAH
jgi:hypothetical protein